MSRHRPAAAHPTGTQPAAGDETSAVRFGGACRQEPVRPPSGVIAIERSARVAAKIARAQQILQDPRFDGPRARLLRVAVLRRDEVLLDGLLAELVADERSARPSRRSPSR